MMHKHWNTIAGTGQVTGQDEDRTQDRVQDAATAVTSGIELKSPWYTSSSSNTKVPSRT